MFAAALIVGVVGGTVCGFLTGMGAYFIVGLLTGYLASWVGWVFGIIAFFYALNRIVSDFITPDEDPAPTELDILRERQRDLNRLSSIATIVLILFIFRD